MNYSSVEILLLLLVNLGPHLVYTVFLQRECLSWQARLLGYQDPRRQSKRYASLFLKIASQTLLKILHYIDR